MVRTSFEPQPKRWNHRTLNHGRPRSELRVRRRPPFFVYPPRACRRAQDVQPRRAFFVVVLENVVRVRGTGWGGSDVVRTATKTVVPPYSKSRTPSAVFRSSAQSVPGSLKTSHRVGHCLSLSGERPAVREPGRWHRPVPPPAWENGGSAVLQVGLTAAPPPTHTSPLYFLLSPLSAAGRASAGWWKRPHLPQHSPAHTSSTAHNPCRGFLS